jgi:opacity protein-like surface antigen
MRPILAVIGIAALLAGSAFAQQPRQLTTELSLSGTGGSISTSTSSSAGSSSSENQEYFTLALRAGFFVIEGFSLEPEFLLSTFEGVPPSMALAGNVSYTFSPAHSLVRPFLIAGVGVGNSIPIVQTPLGRTSDSFNVLLLNAGAGIKIFVTESAAIRVEYRYQRYSYSIPYTVYSYMSYRTVDYDYTVNLHKVLLGVSLFL